MKARLSLLLAAFLLAVAPAHAHKVIASVYPSGRVIEGEIGFSNGDMAANVAVTVFDNAGNALGETATDADGFFTFTPTESVAHVFRADLGAGHVAEVTMAAADVARILGKAEARPAGVAEAAGAEAGQGGAAVAALGPAALEAIATAVRDEMRPLRREIDAYKEKNDLQSILGGIGYIVGIFGLGFYLAARRKLQA